MSQVIKIKHSIIPTNTPASLQTGELAINVTDGSLFFGSATTVYDSFKFGALDVTNNLTVVGEVYADMIKRESSNSNTTKIKSSANKWEIYAGNSSDEVMKIELGQVTIDGEVEMGTDKITGLGDPTTAQDAATKAYVDSQTHTDGAVTGTGVNNRLAIWDGTAAIDSDADFYVGTETLFAKSLTTIGAILTGSDGNSSQWNDAYNNQVTAIGNAGTSTVTLTLTQSDAGTLTTDFVNPQGTVTSVASTTTGDALDVSVTDSTIAAAIALSWAGSSSQYIDGAGDLTDFPTIPAGDITAVNGGTYITTTDSIGPVPIVNHDATSRTDTTSATSPAHGATFTSVDSVSTNATGHITALNLKTVTLPADAEGVTSVTATAPVDSTGGNTPVISMPVASTSANGYLSSTNWNTFNNKTTNTGTVTSIETTGTVNGITLTGGEITNTGTITLGGTLGSIANSQLTNSTIGVTAGAGLADGGSISLGSSKTINVDYSSVENLILTATDRQSIAIPGDDIIIYVDIDNGRVVNGLVSDLPFTNNTGTVSSVAISGSDGIDIDSGSPITTSGTIALGLTDVPNSSLANSTVSYGGISLSLGGTDATPAFNLSDATAYPGTSTLITTGTITTGVWNSNRLFSRLADATTQGDYVNFGEERVTVLGKIYFYKDNVWELTDASAVATSIYLLAMAMGTNSLTDGMLIRGMAGEIGTVTGSDGTPLYLSETAGALTATAPTTSSAVVRVVGYALNGSPVLWFNPDNTWVELS